MVLVLAFLLLISCKKSEKEILLVPKNYSGYIIILFDQKYGTPEKMQDGKRVYEIPSSGILKTQFKWNEGLREFPEYYFEKISATNNIPSFTEFNKIPDNKIVGLMGGGGTANKDHAGKERVQFAFYYVGKKDSIGGAIRQVEKIDIASLVR